MSKGKAPTGWTVLAWTVGCVALAILVTHALRYYPFISDDALISLRYSDRLVAGDGLTWTDGERVEGYSNLLWVLACALLGALGLDLIDATRLLGLLGMGSAIVAIIHLYKPDSLASTPPCAVATMAMGLSGTIAVWTIGGLEQPFVVGLLAWAIVCLVRLVERGYRQLSLAVWSGLLLGLLCWTRPDGPIFVVTFFLVLLLVARLRRKAWLPACIVAGIPLGFFSMQLGFRLIYYGDWVPNTAHIKAEFSPRRLSEGLQYVRGALAEHGGLTIMALCAMAVRGFVGEQRWRVLLYTSLLLVWLLYLALIGGDIFPAYRHLAAPVLLMALLTTDLLWSLSRLPRRWPVWAATVIALPLLAFLGWKQISDSKQNERAIKERWEWAAEDVGQALHTAFGEQQALIAVDSAGCIPYFSRLPSVDMLGLNDRYLATHPPPNFGKGKLGHEMGDGDYVLGREPDLVLFRLPYGKKKPGFLSGKQMVKDARFKKHYRLMRYRVGDRKGRRMNLWLRIDSPKIGYQASPEKLSLPGYLLASAGKTECRLDSEIGAICLAAPERPALLERIPLGEGLWEVQVETQGQVRTTVRTGPDAVLLVDNGAKGRFQLDRADNVDISIEPVEPQRVRVERVVLTRIAPNRAEDQSAETR